MLPPVVRVATGNRHKVAELQAILVGWPLDVLAQAAPYPPEDEPDYAGNARIKARHGRLHAEAAAWVIAEDSGIEVDGLSGAPGVHSARFGGDDPVGRLLAELAGVEGEGRRGRYVCELVCLLPDGHELRGTGTLSGRVAHEPAGSEGFGYDPVFVPDGESRTVAELGDAWKAVGSHRARGARALLAAARAAGLVP
jgi:XTP/dITP diphosphohydrolase